jgi:hypothetical protein
MNTAPPPSRRLFDRRFYSWAAVAVALVVFAGFAKTFYLRALFASPALSNLLALHGTVMTLWIAVFITQTRLVAGGRTDLHRRLGVFGGVLAGAMLVVGTAAAIDAGRRGFTPAPEVPPLKFIVLPLVDITLFAVLVGVALWKRRRSDVHKRLMLLATVSILTPAIARIPVPAIHDRGLPMFFGLTILGVVLCVAIDTIRNRRLHPAFGWGGGLVIASLPLRILLAGTAVWMRFATWLVG